MGAAVCLSDVVWLLVEVGPQFCIGLTGDGVAVMGCYFCQWLKDKSIEFYFVAREDQFLVMDDGSAIDDEVNIQRSRGKFLTVTGAAMSFFNISQ
jgi:hypothetical protein